MFHTDIVIHFTIKYTIKQLKNSLHWIRGKQGNAQTVYKIRDRTISHT